MPLPVSILVDFESKGASNKRQVCHLKVKQRLWPTSQPLKGVTHLFDKFVLCLLLHELLPRLHDGVDVCENHAWLLQQAQQRQLRSNNARNCSLKRAVLYKEHYAGTSPAWYCSHAFTSLLKDRSSACSFGLSSTIAHQRLIRGSFSPHVLSGLHSKQVCSKVQNADTQFTQLVQSHSIPQVTDVQAQFSWWSQNLQKPIPAKTELEHT